MTSVLFQVKFSNVTQKWFLVDRRTNRTISPLFNTLLGVADWMGDKSDELDPDSTGDVELEEEDDEEDDYVPEEEDDDVVEPSPIPPPSCDRVRVLRIIEYEGPRFLVEEQVAKSVHGVRIFGSSPQHGVTIRATTLGEFPEIMDRE